MDQENVNTSSNDNQRGSRPDESSSPLNTNTTFDSRQAHIKMLSFEEASSATIDFADLLACAQEHSDESTRASNNDKRTLEDILDENGFAIVSNVLSETDIRHAEGLWAEDLLSIVSPPATEEEKATLDALRTDPVARWPLEQLPLVCRQGAAKFSTDYGLPHGRMPWFCRRHRNVRRVFEELFPATATPATACATTNQVDEPPTHPGTAEHLCCGFDVVFFNNQGIDSCDSSPDQQLTTTLWPHADQNCHVQPSGTSQVYQGVVYLWAADASSSSTIVWPRSHREVYPTMMKGVKHDKHYCALPAAGKSTKSRLLKGETEKGEPSLPEATREAFVASARRVPVPRGGVLLWDSKTLHQGWPHGQRLAVPVGYEPKLRRSNQVLERKKELVLQGMPTDHWGSLGQPHRMARGPGKQAPTEGLRLRHSAHEHLLHRGPASDDEDAQIDPDILGCL